MRKHEEIQEIYDEWLNNLEDEKLLDELENMNETQKEESFLNDISFGTGGLRGILGVGSAKMNLITVKKVTLGFVKYLHENNKNKDISVAITSDCRNMSQEFINLIIAILAKNNIKTYIFNDIKPTPMLSYLVRKKNCDGGIMITASHNPKEYNGYKVYNNTGAQLNLKESDKMIAHVNSTDYDFHIDQLDKDEAIKMGMLEYVNDDFDKIYFKDIDSVIKNDDEKKNIKITYTPLHGTGYKIVPKALRHFGFVNIDLVNEQMKPDGNFPDAESTNPEEIRAYDLALAYAKKNNSDLIIANDPDADRLGIMFKDKQSNYIFLTGNQTGTLLINYLIQRDNLNSGIMYKTIVTGDLGATIAKKHNIKVEETLTGFKFIGEKISNNKTDKFVFGYEESYGYLINDCVRDKDAIQSSLLISEMCNYYLLQNKDLNEVLEEIYEEYGYSYEVTKSLTLSGLKGLEKINKIMQMYKENDIQEFSGYSVESKVDYNLGINGLPKSNVIKFYLNNLGWLVFRPSGTEPKLKVYFSINSNSIQTSKDIIEKIFKDILNKIESI